MITVVRTAFVICTAVPFLSLACDGVSDAFGLDTGQRYFPETSVASETAWLI